MRKNKKKLKEVHEPTENVFCKFNTSRPRSEWIRGFKALGLLIVFASWISENYLQKKYESKIQLINFNRTILLSAKTSVDILKSRFIECQNDYRSDTAEYLRENYINSCASYCAMALNERIVLMQMQKASGIIVSEEELRDSVYKYEQLKFDIYELAKSGNKPVLEEATIRLMGNIEGYRNSVVYEINRRQYELSKNIELTNNVALIFYILGSIFLALSFIGDWRYERISS